MLQLLDTNKDNMIDFRDFAWFMGVVCVGDVADRLKLLYRLHLPPALLATDIEDIAGGADSPKSGISQMLLNWGILP